ncbi:MAG: CheR family methyltransferase [Bacteroidota bacterium]
MPQINIVETKNIIRLIREKYNFDLTPLVVNSLRYKLDNIIISHNLRDADHLYEKLNGVPDFFDLFLSEIFYSGSELFRDPEMWEILKNKIIPELIHKYGRINILISQSSCGSDLYAFCILMNKVEGFQKMDLHFTWMSRKDRDHIKAGKIEKSLLESSLKNIKKIFPQYSYDKYLIQKNKEYFFDGRFMKNLSHSKHSFTDTQQKNRFHLILCRNKFLLFNIDYQNLMVDTLVRYLVTGGILVIGFKEDISDYRNKSTSLEELNSLEKIYRKKHH